MVSALTMLGLDEMMARCASYEDLAEIVRHRFSNPTETLHELFGRILLNIFVGNTDDHARNHAAFWNGSDLALTPAYNICPQPRPGHEASHAMLIAGQDRSSRIETALVAAPAFHLSEADAVAMAQNQLSTMRASWREECDAAGLGDVDQALLKRRQFLNPFAFTGFRPAAQHLALLVGQDRAEA